MKPRFKKSSTKEQFFIELSGEVKNYFRENKRSRYGDKVVLLKGIIFITLLISIYAMMLSTENSPWILFSLYIAFGFLIALATFNFAHDACHHSLSPNKKFNDLVFYFLFNLQGVSGFLWKRRHIESHHVHANVEGADPDLEETRLLRLHPSSQFKMWHRLQHVYAPLLYLFYSLNWVLFKDFKFIFSKKQGSLQMRNSIGNIISVFAVKIIYSFVYLVIPWLTTGFSFGYILVCFLAMHAVVSLFLTFTFLISHFCMEVQMPEAVKNDTIENSWAEHQIEISADFHSQSKWAIHIFGGFNTHVAHHLFPNVCHVHYPAITRIVKRTLSDHSIDYHEFSYLKGIGSHFRLLKKLSKT